MTVEQLILKRHKTPEGIMMPIYHDYNAWFKGHIPKMCYVTTLVPGSSKGVILHQRRTACMTAVTGNVELFYADNDDDVIRRVNLNIEENNEDTSFVTIVHPNTAISLANTSDKTTAIIINLPSPAWHPDDEDTMKFKGWQEYFAWRSSQPSDWAMEMVSRARQAATIEVQKHLDAGRDVYGYCDGKPRVVKGKKKQEK